MTLCKTFYPHEGEFTTMNPAVSPQDILQEQSVDHECQFHVTYIKRLSNHLPPKTKASLQSPTLASDSRHLTRMRELAEQWYGVE